MLRDVFQLLKGVERYGVISTLIFVVFFGGVILHSLSLRKKDAEDYSRMPFEDSTKDSDEV
jgi:cbb3-type cytochrome oxidase subunit 3